MTKKRWEKTHFKTRVKQRFGINISKNQIKSIKRKIYEGKLPVYKQQSTNRLLYVVDIGYTEPVLIAYDRKRHELITAMKYFEDFVEKDVDECQDI